MSAEHTPGPWDIQKRDGHSMYGVRPVIVPKDGHIDRIAVVSYRGGAKYPDECDANAHLIAAAPDLLEACQQLVRDCACDNDPVDGGDWGSVEWCEWVAAAIDKAKAAITKATGGTP